MLLQPLDGLLYVANIAVEPGAAGRGIGLLLMNGAEHRGRQALLPGLSLATFRTLPWNGPWFRRQGYAPIPLDLIGPGLRAILDRHATFLDMSMRDTLWKSLRVSGEGPCCGAPDMAAESLSAGKST